MERRRAAARRRASARKGGVGKRGGAVDDVRPQRRARRAAPAHGEGDLLKRLLSGGGAAARRSVTHRRRRRHRRLSDQRLDTREALRSRARLQRRQRLGRARRRHQRTRTRGRGVLGKGWRQACGGGAAPRTSAPQRSVPPAQSNTRVCERSAGGALADPHRRLDVVGDHVTGRGAALLRHLRQHGGRAAAADHERHAVLLAQRSLEAREGPVQPAQARRRVREMDGRVEHEDGHHGTGGAGRLEAAVVAQSEVLGAGEPDKLCAGPVRSSCSRGPLPQRMVLYGVDERPHSH
mmetsp:Transcript_36731/g.118492  ORF Transcript_36731/g.118492 Transcript_36731/m.118492 type:complete len:293 (-) Transcript_36731:119-997(-)